jgi:hypothetical protein
MTEFIYNEERRGAAPKIELLGEGITAEYLLKNFLNLGLPNTARVKVEKELIGGVINLSENSLASCSPAGFSVYRNNKLVTSDANDFGRYGIGKVAF